MGAAMTERVGKRRIVGHVCSMFRAMELANGVPGRGAVAAAVAAGIVALAVGGDHAHAPSERPQLQAGVTGNGFLVAQYGQTKRSVVAVGRDGSHQRLADLRRDGEVRVVGSMMGPIAGYRDGKRVRLVRIADDTDHSMWGTDAQRLCEGVASNDARFAIGWLEGGGGIMFVHGPTSRAHASIESVAAIEAVSVAPATWCGLASAEDKVALFWRDRDRLLFQTCTAKRCGRVAASMPFDRKGLVLGIGCVRDACLIASRDPRGTATLTYVTESGSRKWNKPLDTDATHVSIVGAGNRAFAVGYANRFGSYVLRIDRTGTVTQPWSGPAGGGVPELAWSADQLLVAHYTNETLTPITMTFPR
jgi:hypothetical protein